MATTYFLGTDLRFLSRLFSYLVIEGKEDRAFLDALSKKLYDRPLEEYPYEILEKPRDGQKELVKLLISTGKPVIVLRDYDDQHEIGQIVRTFANSLSSLKKHEIEIDGTNILVKDTGSNLTIVATGLPEDEDLRSVGVNRYAMEDYLLKLLAIDKKVKEWASISIGELRGRADKLRTVGSLNKSKALLAALMLIKDISEEDLIKEVIEISDRKVLASLLKPVTDPVFATN